MTHDPMGHFVEYVILKEHFDKMTHDPMGHFVESFSPEVTLQLSLTKTLYGSKVIVFLDPPNMNDFTAS